MTITNDPQTSNAGVAPAVDLVNVVIDGVEMAVPKGTLLSFVRPNKLELKFPASATIRYLSLLQPVAHA